MVLPRVCRVEYGRYGANANNAPKRLLYLTAFAMRSIGRLRAREVPLSPRASWNRNVRRVDRHLRRGGASATAMCRRAAIGLCACFAIAAVLGLEHAAVTRLPQRQARVRSERRVEGVEREWTPAPLHVARRTPPPPPPQPSAGMEVVSRLMAEKKALEAMLRLSVEQGRAMKKSRDRAMELAQAQLALPPVAVKNVAPAPLPRVDSEEDAPYAIGDGDDLSGEAHEWDDFSAQELDSGFDTKGNVVDFD